jgi:hypothetical protein
VPSRAKNRSIGGKVLISTVPRAAEIERSSGGGTSGVAIIAVSVRETTPTIPRTKSEILKAQRGSDRSMMLPPRRRFNLPW